MNKKLRELLEAKSKLQEEAKNLLESKKVDEAKAKTQEIKDLQKEIEVLAELIEDEKEGVKNEMKNKNQKNQYSIETQAFLNAITGKPLTAEMQNALTGATGEDGGYIVPTELVAQILEKRRGLVSLKDKVNVVKTSSAKGSIPVESLASTATLYDVDEATDAEIQELIEKFENINFQIKQKAGLLPINRNLLADEAANLVEHLAKAFSKKAVKTENKDILAVLGVKVKKTLATFKAIKKEFNKLDGGLKGEGFGWIMNADAFGFIDDLEDTTGRGLLQPNPTDKQQMTLLGFPVTVVSNTELPTVGGKAPIYFGNFIEAVHFVDREQLEIASSDQYRFGRNQVTYRVSERYDVVEGDQDAFVAGEIDVTAYLA